MNQFWSGDECERAQTLMTTTTGSKNHKKESTVRLTTRITMLWPPKGLSFTGLRTQLETSARHTLSNQHAQLKEAKTVNLIENDEMYISRPLAWLF